MIQKRKPVHPGEVFREDVLKPLNIDASEVARLLKINLKKFSDLIECKAPLTPEIAIKIGKATGTTPESWLNMQVKLDLWVAEQISFDFESLNNILDSGDRIPGTSY